MKTEKKSEAFSSDFAQIRAVLSVVLVRPRGRRIAEPLDPLRSRIYF